jgi:hypothetical protein
LNASVVVSTVGLGGAHLTIIGWVEIIPTIALQAGIFVVANTDAGSRHIVHEAVGLRITSGTKTSIGVEAGITSVTEVRGTSTVLSRIGIRALSVVGTSGTKTSIGIEANVTGGTEIEIGGNTGSSGILSETGSLH